MYWLFFFGYYLLHIPQKTAQVKWMSYLQLCSAGTSKRMADWFVGNCCASTLAWKIPWAEKPGRLQSMGSLRAGHDWATSLSLFTRMHWRRKWQPTRFFAWKIPGTGEPVGLPSMGSHRVRHDWSDLAATAAAMVYYGYNTKNITK